MTAPFLDGWTRFAFRGFWTPNEKGIEMRAFITSREWFIRQLNAVRKDKRGAVAMEYVVLGGVLVAGVTVAAGVLSDGLSQSFHNLTTSLAAATGG